MNEQVNKLLKDAAVKKGELAITYLQNGRDVMKQNIQKLMNELQTVRLELTMYKQNFEKALLEVNSLSKEKDRLEKENTDLTSENENLQVTNSAHLEANSLLADAHKEAQTANVKLRKETEILSAEVDCLKVANANLQMQCEDEVGGLSSKCEKYLADMQVLRAKNKMLKTKTFKFNIEIGKLRDELKSQQLTEEKENIKLREELDSQRVVEEDLRTRLNGEKQRVVEVQRELENARLQSSIEKDATKETIEELQRTRNQVHILEDAKKQLLKRLSCETERRIPLSQSLHLP